MACILIRRAEPGDVTQLKDKLRGHDAEEVIASGYESPEAALSASLARSTCAFAVELDGIPVALFGVVPDTMLGHSAVVWFLGSEAMARIKKSFVRKSRIAIREFLKLYPVLWNIVDARYSTAISWLESCGAKFDRERPVIGPSGHPFYKFVIREA